MADNQKAIELLDSWLAQPPTREIVRREWYCYHGLHGGWGRYLLPAIAIMFGNGRYNHGELVVIIRWWAWEIQAGYVNRVCGTEPL